MSQYEDELIKLLKYILIYMLTEAEKIERFIQGLWRKVHRGMSYVEASLFWEMVAKAVNIEKKLMNYGEITRGKGIAKWGLKEDCVKVGISVQSSRGK